MLGTKWKTFFFDKFPSWYKRNDTYKDNNDEGLLERFLKLFGTYVYDIEDYIDNWINYTNKIKQCNNG